MLTLLLVVMLGLVLIGFPIIVVVKYAAVVVRANAQRRDSKEFATTTACPQCGRLNSAHTRVCPRCETRL
jgi:hypothetical protein